MPSDGLAALRRRADAGNPVAAAYVAVLAALGAGEPQSWPTALQRLARAAELGSPEAQGQLRVLSGRTDEAQFQADWAEMAAAVDVGPWLEAGAVQRVGDLPRMLTVPAFLPPAVCGWLIHRAKARLARAKVYDTEAGGVAEASARSNSAFEFGMADLDLVVVLVRTKIAATVGVELSSLETLQMLHYAPGQAFAPHYDFLDPAVPGYAVEIERAGQRRATFLVYLNEEFEGGQTDFPRLGMQFKGKVGDAILWANLDAAGQPDRSMLHAGLPPTSGEKWLFSQWIRDR